MKQERHNQAGGGRPQPRAAAPIENSSLYQAMFEEMSEAFALHEMIYNQHGNAIDSRFLKVNPAFERLTGLTRAQVIGRTLKQVLPETEAEWFRDFGQVALSGEPITAERFHAQLGKWYRAHIYRPAEGQFACIFVDVTEERRIAHALHESERRFRLATEAISGIVYELEWPNGRVLRSAGVLALLGYAPEQVQPTAEWWATIIHPADRSGVWEQISKAVTERAFAVSAEYRVRHADGRWIWVWDRARISHPTESGPPRLLGCTISVDERRRAEQHSEEMRNRLEMALEAARTIAWEWNAELDEITYSPNALEVFGMPVEALPRTRAEGLSWLHPDDLPSHLERVQAATRAAGAYISEYRVRRKGRLDQWIWVEDRGQLTRDSDGRLTRMTGVLSDVDDRRRAQEALRVSEERFRALVESSPDVIFQLDRDLRHTYTSPRIESLTGIAPAAFIGKTAFDAGMPAELWPAFRDACALALETGDPQSLEFTFHKGSEPHWLQARLIPQRDESGSVASLLGIINDLTERKALEQQRDDLLRVEQVARRELEQAHRVKDEFLALVSHELRAPLNAILGWSQMLRRGTLNPAETAEALEIVERNALLQKQLVGDLLDMSRIASGKLYLERQPADIAVLARETATAIRPQAEAAGLQFDSNIQSGAGHVFGDAGRIEQVLWNLLSNAIKFTPTGGRVHLSVRREGGIVRIEVFDTGIGIHPSFLPQLFQRFRQADSSTTRRYRGLGMGLSIVKELVELHGGAVRAESDGEGKGARFVVELPLMEDWPAPKKSADASRIADARPSLAGASVLLVDDDPVTLTLVGRMLEHAGAGVETASSAKAALDLLRERTFDVLVSDISMPEEDGYSLMTRIRALPERDRARMPALALTAFARPEDRRRAIQSGFQCHVSKPVEAAELVALVASLSQTGK